MVRVKDLTGKKFGKLIALSREEKNTSYGGSRWVCICDCGKKVIVAALNLSHGDTRSCGCIKGISRRKGTKNISGTYWSSVKNNAKVRDKEFKISIEFAQYLLEKQEFKCALTNVPLICDVNNSFAKTKRYDLNTASLDRIDSSKGYIEGNVQWVHKDVNNIKQDYEEGYFIDICEKIVKNKGKYPKYLPTLAELIDRLSIISLKEIKIPNHKEEYSKEINDILHDIDLIISRDKVRFTAEMIRAIIIVAQYNNHIWNNESNYRNGIKEGNDLELTHTLNGIRNIGKNIIQSSVTGNSRKDYKIDCLAADANKWVPSGYDK